MDTKKLNNTKLERLVNMTGRSNFLQKKAGHHLLYDGQKYYWIYYSWTMSADEINWTGGNLGIAKGLTIVKIAKPTNNTFAAFLTNFIF